MCSLKQRGTSDCSKKSVHVQALYKDKLYSKNVLLLNILWVMLDINK